MRPVRHEHRLIGRRSAAYAELPRVDMARWRRIEQTRKSRLSRNGAVPHCRGSGYSDHANPSRRHRTQARPRAFVQTDVAGSRGSIASELDAFRLSAALHRADCKAEIDQVCVMSIQSHRLAQRLAQGKQLPKRYARETVGVTA